MTKENFRSTARALLKQGKAIELSTSGCSMFPFIQNGDKGIVRSISDSPISVGDIVLYTQHQQLVAHRIIRISQSEDTTYITTRGDANNFEDKAINFDSIHGKLVAIKRKKRNYPESGIYFSLYKKLTIQPNKAEKKLFLIISKWYKTKEKIGARSRETIKQIRLLSTNAYKSCFYLFICSILNAIFPLAGILYLKKLIDNLNTIPANTSTLYWLLVVSVLIYTANTIVANISSYQKTKLGFSIQTHLYDLLQTVHTSLDFPTYESSAEQDRLHRIIQESTHRPLRFMFELMNGVRSLVSAGVITGILACINWRIIIILFVAAIPSAIIHLYSSKTHYRLQKKHAGNERRLHYYNRILTAYSYAKEVRIFGLSDYFRNRFFKLQAKLVDDKSTLIRNNLTLEMCAQLIAIAVLFGTLTWVVLQKTKGEITTGTVVLFIFSIQRGYSALSEFLLSVSQLIENSAYLNDLVELISETDRKTKNKDVEKHTFSLKHELTFDKVSFSYKKNNVKALDNVSISIKSGSKIALVGENGSGKTTFLKLACGFYPADEGNVYFDKKDINTIKKESLYAKTSAVFQDFALFYLSAHDNIFLGDTKQAENNTRIADAAKVAGIHDTIKQLPMEYDTQLGNMFENGAELSLGQWQKIAIARAIYKNSSLVVMDEPSSALDPRAEELVIDGLKKLSENKTAIIVSHRAKTISWVDEILFFEKGQIVERGTHSELMVLNGKYARLFAGESIIK